MQTTTLTAPEAAFWDRIAVKYARRPVSDQHAYEAKLKKMGTLLRPEDRVLEIGCGTGSTALRLAPLVGAYVATDISGEMLRIAEGKRTATTPGNLEFCQHRADVPLDAQPFDVVCGFSLLHLVDDVPATLRAVRQQLKPGGLFISKTVCLREVAFPIRMFVRVLTALGIAPTVAAFRGADLIRQIEEAGFEIDAVDYFTKNRLNPFIVARNPD